MPSEFFKAAPPKYQYPTQLIERKRNRLSDHYNKMKSKPRLFQLCDFLYSEMYTELMLNNKKLLLHGIEAENFGDISQLYGTADLIKNARPDCDIHIMLQLNTKPKELVNKMFSVDRYPTSFSSGGDYDETEAILEAYIKERAILGVAVPMGSPQLYMTHHRTLKETGNYQAVNGNNLSAGLHDLEEGIFIPNVTPRKLSDIQYEWLKNATGIDSADYSQKTKLYNLYMHSWQMQLIGINAIIEMEKEDVKTLDIISPLGFTLNKWIEWKILDVEHLKKMGVGKITRITSSETETITLGEGKELRILSGNFDKPDMEALQQHAERFFGCTGDMSFSESVALNKIPFYEVADHKVNFFTTLKEMATELQLTQLSVLFNLLTKLDDLKIEAYKKYKTDNGLRQTYLTGRFPMKLEDPRARITWLEFIKNFQDIAHKVAECYADPKLQEEADILNKHIKKYYDIKDKVLAIVDRGIILNNYPELIAVEKSLQEKFLKDQISLDVVFEELKTAMQDILAVQMRNSPSPT